MPLRPDFQFSQTSLQDYLDCPRRFELRFILRVDWPAVLSEPVLESEQLIEQGRRFHLLVHQYLLGVPAGQLLEQSEDAELRRWWENLDKSALLSTLPVKRFPEHSLVTWISGFRLAGKFDLLALEPGVKAVIVDWKTSQRRPSDAFLKQRIQSRLYPFLLAEAGTTLNGGVRLTPEQIEMVFWFPNHPERPLHFLYSQDQYLADRAYLSAMIEEIKDRKDGAFFLTGDEKHCALCQYRSLCDRGQRAGNWAEMEDERLPEDEGLLEIDFEQIAEIEF